MIEDIHKWTDELPGNAVRISAFRLYLHLLSRGQQTEFPANAILTLRYPDLRALDPSENLKLLMAFRDGVMGRVAAFPEIGTPQVFDAIVPESDGNIITHERQHVEPLPEETKKEAVVYVVYGTQEYGGNILQGTAHFPRTGVTYRDLAMAASEPSSLNRDDMDKAMFFAHETKDPAFIKSILKRVMSRKSHG